MVYLYFFEYKFVRKCYDRYDTSIYILNFFLGVISVSNLFLADSTFRNRIIWKDLLSMGYFWIICWDLKY
jgi:hypothetical protein